MIFLIIFIGLAIFLECKFHRIAARLYSIGLVPRQLEVFDNNWYRAKVMWKVVWCKSNDPAVRAGKHFVYFWLFILVLLATVLGPIVKLALKVDQWFLNLL